MASLSKTFTAELHTLDKIYLGREPGIDALDVCTSIPRCFGDFRACQVPFIRTVIQRIEGKGAIPIRVGHEVRSPSFEVSDR